MSHFSNRFFNVSRALIFTFSFFTLTSAHAGPLEFLHMQNEMLRAGFTIHDRTLAPLETRQAVMLQKLDHNSSTDTRTFSQRYWVNSSKALGLNSPVLLYICGEGACSRGSVEGQALRHATTLNAHVVALEHRYYGESQPFSDLRTENLRYLNVDQALKDLLSFQALMKNQSQWTGPWIVVGGSYAGALSAYAREKYPEAFIGSLASSAPVYANLNFDTYDRHVARMAGPECLAAIHRVVPQIEAAIQTDEGFAQTKAAFEASPLNDRDDFLYLIADTAAGAVQYGMRDRFCAEVVSGGLEGYARATKMVAGLFGNLVDLSAQAAEDISLDKAKGPIGMRQWFYQSCTEFGYWQNAWADAKESSRSTRINAQYHARICERLFNIKTPAQTDVTNATYYEPLLASETTRILFTNGSVDPWLNLSINEDNKNNTNPNLTSFMIGEAAHCDDLRAGGSTAVVEAKELFLNLASGWLNR